MMNGKMTISWKSVTAADGKCECGIVLIKSEKFVERLNIHSTGRKSKNTYARFLRMAKAPLTPFYLDAASRLLRNKLQTKGLIILGD